MEGDLNETEAKINTGLKSDPSFAYFYNVLGLLNCMRQNYEQSLKYHSKAIEL
jgi:hypothetical protein